MKKELTLLQLEVTIKEILKTKVFRDSMKKMVYFTISQLQEHYNKIMLLRKTIVYYLQIKIYIRPILKKPLYELWKERKSNILYLHPFGCGYFILDTTDNLAKFDPKFNNGILLRYTKTSKSLIVEESIYVRFDDHNSDREVLKLNDSFADLNMKRNKSTSNTIPEREKNLNLLDVRIRSTFKDQAYIDLFSKMKPKIVDKALMDEDHARRARLVSKE
ncbi:hypothetical protein CR513_22511, partial [Mucuna pruriens]